MCDKGSSFSWFSSWLKFVRKFNLSELREPLFFFFLSSEGSSWPPESKPDVLIRPKDNKLQIEILSMADHQRRGLQHSLNAWNSSPMHINAQQILSPLSSNLGRVHSKPVIWDCLSENQRLLCSQISPSPLPWVDKDRAGLFWQRQQVPSQTARAGVSAKTQGPGWPASHLLFPCVSWYTCHPHSERF